MANIAFFQNRLGRTDGVSLEVDKWRKILEKMGHVVFYCSGNDDVEGNYVIEELYAEHEITAKILKNATRKFEDYQTEAQMEREIYNHAQVIEEKLQAFIKEKDIQLLIPNNLCSGGFQPAAAIAFHNIIRKTNLPTIIHSHDFYFESELSKEVFPTCYTAKSIYNRYFPINLPNVTHVVINNLAKEWLKENKNIDATVVPNVFDFQQSQWSLDAYNSDFRQRLDISGNDLVFLQATRILDRKGIELAIDLVGKIDKSDKMRKKLYGTQTALGGTFNENSKIILLCAGIVETIGISGEYWTLLKDKAENQSVDLRYCGDIVKHSRADNDAIGKIYSLWDTYVNSDFVTYPSLWEGWGNQLIEAVFAKLPFVVFEYPVFISDIKEKGFKYTSLGDMYTLNPQTFLAEVEKDKLEKAAEEIVDIISNSNRKKEVAKENFDIASQAFSYEKLQEHISELLKRTNI